MRRVGQTAAEIRDAAGSPETGPLDGDSDWSQTFWHRWFGFPRRWPTWPTPHVTRSFTWTVDARAPGSLGAWSRVSTFAAPTRAAACVALGSLAAQLGGLELSVTAWDASGRYPVERHSGSLYQATASLGCPVSGPEPQPWSPWSGGIGNPDIYPWSPWSGGIGNPDIYLATPYWGRGESR